MMFDHFQWGQAFFFFFFKFPFETKPLQTWKKAFQKPWNIFWKTTFDNHAKPLIFGSLFFIATISLVRQQISMEASENDGVD